MATHSRIFAGKIQWTEDPAGYSPQGHKESTQVRTSAITGDAKRLFTCFLAIGDVSSLEKCLFRSGFFASLILSCMNCLGTLEVNPLTVTSFPDIFSQSVGCLFCSVYGLLHC